MSREVSIFPGLLQPGDQVILSGSKYVVTGFNRMKLVSEPRKKRGGGRQYGATREVRPR